MNIHFAWDQRTRWTVIVLVISLGIYLVVNHEKHLSPYLPYAFLFGCFFMHLFMHGGHKGNEKGGEDHKHGGD